MRTLKRLVTIATVILISGGLGYIALKEQPVLVDVATVDLAPMTVTIKEEGVTRVRDIYQVFPPVTGRVDRVLLEEGDTVEKDVTLVARIHQTAPPFIDVRTASELKAAVEAAQSAVQLAKVEQTRAQADLILAQTEYKRADELASRQFVSEANREKIYNDVLVKKAIVESAAATIALREAELKTALARQIQPSSFDAMVSHQGCCMEIKAPVSGTVLQVATESAKVVTTAMPIVEIGNPDDLEIAVDLLSSDAVKITTGDKVLISDWGGEGDLDAKVRRIDPAGFTKVSALGIEEQRVNAVLELDSVPARLGHGYRVFADFVIWSDEEVLQIPIGALFRSNGNWAVFIIEGENAALREITLGHMNDDYAQVMTGITRDEQVVLYPNDQLVDGGIIKIREEQ